MKTLSIDEAYPVWDKFLDQCKQEAFKVEVLQDYYAHDKGPSLDAWLAGDRQKSLDIIRKQGPGKWHEDYAKRSIRKIRLHIVEEPYTPYIEWEIELYKLIIIPYTGEEVSLVPQADVSNLDIPDGDFWIFDDKRVVQYRYRDTRSYEADVYDVAQGDNISRFLDLKPELLKHAKKLG